MKVEKSSVVISAGYLLHFWPGICSHCEPFEIVMENLWFYLAQVMPRTNWLIYKKGLSSHFQIETEVIFEMHIENNYLFNYFLSTGDHRSYIKISRESPKYKTNYRSNRAPCNRIIDALHSNKT